MPGFGGLEELYRLTPQDVAGLLERIGKRQERERDAWRRMPRARRLPRRR